MALVRYVLAVQMVKGFIVLYNGTHVKRYSKNRVNVKQGIISENIVSPIPTSGKFDMFHAIEIRVNSNIRGMSSIYLFCNHMDLPWRAELQILISIKVLKRSH